MSSTRQKPYYINDHTGVTTWDFPTEEAIKPASSQVQALHILKKHSVKFDIIFMILLYMRKYKFRIKLVMRK